MTKLTRRRLDDAFPTVVRYTGLLLTVVLVVATIITQSLVYSSGFVAATGMILYKTVRDAARNSGNGNGNGHGRGADDQ